MVDDAVMKCFQYAVKRLWHGDYLAARAALELVKIYANKSQQELPTEFWDVHSQVQDLEVQASVDNAWQHLERGDTYRAQNSFRLALLCGVHPRSVQDLARRLNLVVIETNPA